MINAVLRIKVTSLGASGAGKTCFMLGMYSVMQVGLRGFTFSTPDLDLDLRLTADWDTLVGTRGADRWPPPTDQPHTMSFNFNYAYKTIMGFDWFDYRGSALNETSSNSEFTSLLSHLEQSASVFLCIDGTHLIKHVQPCLRDVMRAAGIIRMNQLMQKVQENGLKPSIVIVITKYDICARHRSATEIVEDIKELFHPLFTSGSKWLVSICPMSLGVSLWSDSGNAEIAPKNVHLPVTFAIHSVLGNVLEKTVRDRNEKSQTVSALGPTFIHRWWNDSKISMAKKDVQISSDLIEAVKKNLILLGNELVQDSRVYYDGKEQVRDDAVGAAGPW